MGSNSGASELRREAIDRCLASLAWIEYPRWRLIVVDQGTSTESLAVLGISRARNAAIDRSSAHILAFIDDDCTVPASWLDAIASAFVRSRGSS